MERVLKNLGFDADWQLLVSVVSLAFARLLPIVAFNPFFGGRTVPGNVKVGMTFLLALLLYPPLASNLPAQPPKETVQFMLMLIKESIVGATIGFVSSLVFHAVQSAGALLDIQRGASMMNVLVPQLEVQASILGQFKFQMAIVLFLTLDGHHLFLRSIFKSFEALPLTTYPSFGSGFGPLAEQAVRLSGDIFSIAILLSAPALVALFLTDVAFGVLNRISPQINVFFLSMPLKMAVGILVVLLVISFMLRQMEGYLASMIQAVNGWIAGLAM